MAEESKDKRAVALGFEKGDDTPRVIASGRGKLADRITEGARDAGIPIYRDSALVMSLSALDLNEFIPPELYGVVVDVLEYVGKIDEVKAKLERHE